MMKYYKRLPKKWACLKQPSSWRKMTKIHTTKVRTFLEVCFFNPLISEIKIQILHVDVVPLVRLESLWDWLSGTNPEMSTSRDLKPRVSLCCIPPFCCERFEWPKPKAPTHYIHLGGGVGGGGGGTGGAKPPIFFGVKKHFYGCMWHYLWHRCLQSARFLPSDNSRTTEEAPWSRTP